MIVCVDYCLHRFLPSHECITLLWTFPDSLWYSYWYFLKNKIWTTLEKDPLFSKPMETPTMEDYREATFLRCKRLFEYNLITDEEIFSNPLKHKMFTDCVGMYDWSLSAKFLLNVEMTGGTITASGSPRHGEIVDKIKNFEVSYM